MESFKFFLGADIAKSADSEGRRIIRGYASTSAEDRQGESLVQKGLDISDFKEYGYFNFDHDNSIIVGFPHAEKCHVDDKGLWVEGELFKGMPEADRMWDLAVAIKKSNAPRKVGFSVEGKVLERDGNRITKAKIYNIAVTANPVNTTCSWEAVVKSFSGNASDEDFLIEKVNKSLEAGYETNPTDMEGGSVFRKESLEHDLKNLSYVMDSDANKKILKDKLATKKSFTRNETILYLQIMKGWSRSECTAFLDNMK